MVGRCGNRKFGIVKAGSRGSGGISVGRYPATDADMAAQALRTLSPASDMKAGGCSAGSTRIRMAGKNRFTRKLKGGDARPTVRC